MHGEQEHRALFPRLIELVDPHLHDVTWIHVTVTTRVEERRIVQNPLDRKLHDPGCLTVLHELLMEEGLICRPMFESLGFSPPLILSRADVDSIVEMFSKGLEKLTKELTTARE
jgi:adenosylmethionine-8-amino-7-oxononanoate aminotransferase